MVSALGISGLSFGVGIQGVLPLPGGTNTLTVVSMSADGSTVVGNSSGANGFEAFRWTSSGGTVGLGDFAGGGFSSFANGASFDGSKIAGRGTPDITRGFLWTSPTGLQRLNNISGGTATSDQGFAISTDGNTIVGQSNSLAFGIRATRWQGSGLGVVLDDLAGGSAFGEALAVNSDGSVIVGWGTSAAGSEATRWVNGVLTNLGDLTGGTLTARSTAVSEDGAVVYGRGSNANGTTSWRWTSATGMVQMEPNMVGELGFNSEVFGTNADGSVAAMRVSNQAALYIHGVGTQFLETILTTNGINYSGFDLLNARAVSSDGLTIAGNGFVNNVIAGYRVQLPTHLGWVSLNGIIDLEDWTPGPSGQPVTLELWSGSTRVRSIITSLRADGRFGWATGLAGSYTLRVKGSHWLAKAVPVSLTVGSNASVGTLNLINGDVNDDNEIGPADFSLLSGAFGSFAGDPAYLLSADLNGDDEVGPADFAILAANFGEFGE